AASDLRERRRSPRAWPDVPAVPREPAPPRARPGGCPDPPALQGQEAPRGPRAVGCGSTGRGAAWLARLTGGQKVAGSNPAGPTDGVNEGVAPAMDPSQGSPPADRSHDAPKEDVSLSRFESVPNLHSSIRILLIPE